MIRSVTCRCRFLVGGDLFHRKTVFSAKIRDQLHQISIPGMEILRICHIAFAKFNLDVCCRRIVIGSFLAGSASPTGDIKRQHFTSCHVSCFIKADKKMGAFLDSGLVPMIPVLILTQEIRSVYIAPQIGICCPGAMYQYPCRLDGNLICWNA